MRRALLRLGSAGQSQSLPIRALSTTPVLHIEPVSVYELEGLRLIEISRPEDLNSLDLELAGEINRLLEKW